MAIIFLKDETGTIVPMMKEINAIEFETLWNLEGQ